MTLLIIAITGTLLILLARHWVTTRHLLGQPLLKRHVSIEDGRKRTNPSSVFLIATTLWLVLGIYLYVWRELTYEKLRSALGTLEMPEALRQLLLPLPLGFWAVLAFIITVVIVAWFFLSAKRGRVVVLGTKGLAIGDCPYLWHELSNLTLNEKQLCFFVEKQSHHYSWHLDPQALKAITPNLPKPQDNSQS